MNYYMMDDEQCRAHLQKIRVAHRGHTLFSNSRTGGQLSLVSLKWLRKTTTYEH